MGLRNRIGSLLSKNFNLTFKKINVQRVGQREYFVVNDSFSRGDYDDAWTLALAKRSKIIFDIGSNMGQAALLMMYGDHVQEIYLVDPNPSALSIAAENFIRNNLSHKARFIPSFASDQADKEVDFYTVGAGAAGSMYSGHAVSASKANSHFKVPTTTIDKISGRYNVNPDFIKIDVEGAEAMVLRGAMETVQRSKPKILVEMHSNPELPMVKNADLLLEWCENNNYTAWYMKTGFPIENADMVSKRGRFHALLLPKGEPYPEYLKLLKQGDPVESAING